VNYSAINEKPAQTKARYTSWQAVMECGCDENLEKGAAHQLLMTTQVDVCFRKILQRNFLHRRSSRSTSSNSSKLKAVKKHQKRRVLASKSASSPMK
jgi:hypothetical protein